MTPGRLLENALVRDPARPLLTYYDDASGERTELSVATYANWVAKTANLLVDGLGAVPGDRLAVRLPLHWQAAVWLGAGWAAGLVLTDGSGPAPDVAVVTPGTGRVDAGDVVSLGLGPLGLPGPEPAAPGTIDFDREVHGYGDRFTPARASHEEDAALETGTGVRSAGDLADAARDAAEDWAVRPGDRILTVRAIEDHVDVLATLLVPLQAGATAVLCRNLDPAMLADRAATESVVLGCGVSTASIPDLRRR